MRTTRINSDNVDSRRDCLTGQSGSTYGDRGRTLATRDRTSRNAPIVGFGNSRRSLREVRGKRGRTRLLNLTRAIYADRRANQSAVAVGAFSNRNCGCC